MQARRKQLSGLQIRQCKRGFNGRGKKLLFSDNDCLFNIFWIRRHRRTTNGIITCVSALARAHKQQFLRACASYYCAPSYKEVSLLGLIVFASMNSILFHTGAAAGRPGRRAGRHSACVYRVRRKTGKARQGVVQALVIRGRFSNHYSVGFDSSQSDTDGGRGGGVHKIKGWRPKVPDNGRFNRFGSPE